MAHDFSVETYNEQVSAVWKATLWLTVITILEVGAALLWLAYVDPTTSKMVLNIFFIFMSLLKAAFIVGEFMHVRYETRALTLTILVPTIFLIWFIGAFLWEGTEWQNNREFWGVMDHTPAAHHHGHDDGHKHDNHSHDGHKHDHKHDHNHSNDGHH